jgi:hypothetical protein
MEKNIGSILLYMIQVFLHISAPHKELKILTWLEREVAICEMKFKVKTIERSNEEFEILLGRKG